MSRLGTLRPDRDSEPGEGFMHVAISIGKLFPSLLKDARGAAILEFAIAVPLLVVFVVGIYDFSGAFNQKQKLAQAAQEAAIIAGAQPMSDIDPTNTNSSGPDSLLPVWSAAYNSLVSNGVLATGTCTLPPGTISGPAANLVWTYKISGCPDDLIIVVTRGLSIPVANPPPGSVLCSVVQVTYPYHWRFNSVIQLLIPGAHLALPLTISESATVHNQT